MDKIKIGDGEIKIMEYIWNRDSILKRLVEKGMIQRRDPGFHCYALVSREQVQQEETRSLIDKVYNGSRRLFLASFLSREKLTQDEIDEIEKIIEANK